MKKDKQILVDWFVEKVEEDGSNFADIVDVPAKLAFFLLDENMKLNEPIKQLSGKIVFFVTSEGSGEVAFQPNEKEFIEYKDFDFGEKYESDDNTPQLWTMFLVERPEGWIQLIPHNFSDIIDFSKDHTISIDRVNPRYVNDGVSMESFANDANALEI